MPIALVAELYVIPSGALPAVLAGKKAVYAEASPLPADQIPLRVHRWTAPERAATWDGEKDARCGASVAVTTKGIRVAFTMELGGERVQRVVTIPEGRVAIVDETMKDGRTVVVILRAREVAGS